MSNRLCTCVVAALPLAALVGAAAADPQDATPRTAATANGPVSLIADRTPASAPAGDARPLVDEASVDSRPDAAEPVPRVPGAAPASFETQPLGATAAADEGPLRVSATADGGGETIAPAVMDVLRVGGALAVVVGLIALFRVAVRRGGGLGPAGRPSGVLEVLARYPLGRGQSLLLLKVARRVVLVHQGGGSMRTLSEMTTPDEVAAVMSRIEAGTRRSSRSFRSALRGFESSHVSTGTTARGATLLPDDRPEIVDLTDSPHAALRRLLETRRIEA